MVRHEMGQKLVWPFLAALGVLLLLGLASAGCAHRRSADSSAEVSLQVLAGWRAQRDYYALLEIVDAYIDPFAHKASKQKVKELLGAPDADYPNSGPDHWVYRSSRRVPYGSYLCISFDPQGVVTNIDWVSE